MKMELRKQWNPETEGAVFQRKAYKGEAVQTKQNGCEAADGRKYFVCDRDCGISAGRRSSGYTVQPETFTQLAASETFCADRGTDPVHAA